MHKGKRITVSILICFTTEKSYHEINETFAKWQYAKKLPTGVEKNRGTRVVNFKFVITNVSKGHPVSVFWVDVRRSEKKVFLLGALKGASTCSRFKLARIGPFLLCPMSALLTSLA
jgi:hypothetical protein